MKLYELSRQYQEVMELIENGEYALEDLQDTLDSIQDAGVDKAANIISLWKNLNAEVEMFKAEEKRLEERRKSLEKTRDFFQNYLDTHLQLMGLKEVAAGVHKASYKKNPPSLEIVDESKFPAEFIKWKRDYDVQGLKKHLKQMYEEVTGQSKFPEDEIEFHDFGVKIVNNKKSLQIK